MSATDGLDHIASSGKYPGGQKNCATNYNTMVEVFSCGVCSPKWSRGFEKCIQLSSFSLTENLMQRALMISKTL